MVLIGECKGGCKYPECLGIEYREVEEPDGRIKMVAYAICGYCPITTEEGENKSCTDIEGR